MGHINLVGTNSTSWKSIWIFSSHLRLVLPNDRFSSAFPTNSHLSSYHSCCMPSSSSYSWYSLWNPTWILFPVQEAQIKRVWNFSRVFKSIILNYIVGLPIKLGSNTGEVKTTRMTVGPILSRIQLLQGLSLSLSLSGVKAV
jgi:hypothetical protein